VGSAGFTRALTLVRAYGTLLKPKITLLLTAFGLTAALVAAATLGQEVTTGRLVLFALVGLMASGGAACLNHLFDRDIDRTMARTKHRPIPQGVVSPRAAALYAAVLLAVAMPLTFVLLGPAPALFSTALCVGFWRKPSAAAALRVFKSSGAYLGLLIVAMLVDGRF
jgi:protoheme IX farnesyltransferase